MENTSGGTVEEQLRRDPFLKIWVDNFKENIKNNAFSRPNVRPLKYLMNTLPYIGKPLILVAAGPSLDKNLHLLKNYQDRSIIIVNDIILFKLLEYNIKPDFVVLIDPSDSIKRFWDFLDTSDLTLVCPTTISPVTLSSWKGKVITFSQSDRDIHKGKVLKRIETGFGSLENNFFVGATMMQLANILKPRLITLIGHDFAFTDNKAYCDGVLDIKIWDDLYPIGSEEHEKQLKIVKEQEVKKELLVEFKETKEQVYTTRTLVLYKDTLTKLIKQYRLNVVNATEGGIFYDVKNCKFEDILKHEYTQVINKKDIFDISNIKKRRRKRK
jgi:hypothetical protein